MGNPHPSKRSRTSAVSTQATLPPELEYSAFSAGTPDREQDHDQDGEGEEEEGYEQEAAGSSSGQRASGRRRSAGGRPLSATCVYCRSRKIKCDGNVSCSNCTKTNNACVYLAKQKPGLKAGSGATMLHRIETLEDIYSKQQIRLNELEEWRRAMLEGGADGPSQFRQPQMSLQHMQDPSPSHSLVTEPGKPVLGSYSSFPSEYGIQQQSRPPQTSLYQDPQTAAAAAGVARSGGMAGMQSMMGDEPMNSLGDYANGLLPYGPGRGDALRQSLGGGGGRGAGGGGGSGHSPLDGVLDAQLMTANAGFMASPMEPIWTPGSTLPRNDIVRDLIDVFMHNIAPIAFFINPEERFQEPWGVVVHAIVTLAAGLSQDERVSPFKEHIRESARNHVFLECMAKTSIESMQALALISLDVLASGKGPEYWSPLAMLSRVALNLDMARETDNQSPTPLRRTAQSDNAIGGSSRNSSSHVSKTNVIQPSEDWKEDEGRRRLFWFIYVLDRYTSASAGWDPAIPSNVAQRRLPIRDDLWRGEEWIITPKLVSPSQPFGRHQGAFDILSPAAFLAEAMDLMGKTHSLQTRPLDIGDVNVDSRKDTAVAISAIANRWYLDIVRHLGEISDPGVMHPLSMLVHGIHHVTLCKALCFYAYPAINPTGVIEPYASQCLASAQAISELSQRAVANSAHPASASPILIWILWVGARVLFAHSCWEARPVIRPEFTVIVNSLAKMAEHFGLAASYHKLLLRAERKWMAMNSPSSGGSTSMAVSVLLDLRRTAYGATNAAKGDETPAVPGGGDAESKPMTSEQSYHHAAATNQALHDAGLLNSIDPDEMEFQRLMDAGGGSYQNINTISGSNTPWGGNGGTFQPHLAFKASLDSYWDHLDIFGGGPVI